MAETGVMLITGTSRGIGRFLAEHYLKEGWQVVGVSRSPPAVVHPAYRHFEVDVTQEPEVCRMFHELRRAPGRLDALVNNAAIASMNHSLLTPADSLRKVIDVNLVGTFLCCREAAKLMQVERCGRIVNFTSVAVPLRLAGEVTNVVSKGAVESLTFVLAREFAPLGITVNAVGPTAIPTALLQGVPREMIEKLVAQQTIPRSGEFADVLNVVDFFLKPESSFITGQVLYLGGFGR